MGRKILLDGQIKYKDSVIISPDSPALNFGCGLFETVLYRNEKLYFYNEHLQRLRSACRELLIEPPAEDMISYERLTDLADQNGYNKNTARIKIFYAPLSGPDKWNSLVSVEKYGRKDGNVSLKTDPRTRDSSFNRYKSSSYMQNYLSILGTDGSKEIAFVNLRNEITEGSRTNILCLKNGIIYFTGRKENYLQGIMQNMILSDYRDIGFDGIEELAGGFTQDIIRHTEEMIITNSLMISKNVDILNFGSYIREFDTFGASKKINDFYLK